MAYRERRYQAYQAQSHRAEPPRAASDREFGAMRREFGAMRREVGEELRGIREGVASIHGRLDAVSARQAEQAAHITALGGRVAAHDDRFIGVNNRIAAAVEEATLRREQEGAAAAGLGGPAAAPAEPAAMVRSAPVTAGSYVICETPNGPPIMLDDIALLKVTQLYRAFNGRVPTVGARMTAERANRAVLGAGVRKDRVPHAQGSAPGTYRTLQWGSFVSYYNRRRIMEGLAPV